jgi:hypothetical protein
MMMPTDPAAGLVLIEAAFPLGRLNVLLDRPPCRAHLRYLFQRHVRWRVRMVILQLWILTQRSSYQQPLLGTR